MTLLRSFGLIALLIVLLVMLWLSTRQVAFVPAPMLPASGAASAPANVREQSQQLQQQVQQQINQAMEQSRQNMPDDAK
jgi:apolipoprotein N-acyltransferase